MLNFPVVFSAALLDSLNPCAISVLLLTIGFMLSLKSSRVEILKIGTAYIIGIFIVYVLIGLGILRALGLFGVPHILAKVGATLVILFGTFGLYQSLKPDSGIQFGIPKFIKPYLANLIHKASIPTALATGGLVASFEFPCTGGPYLMILGLLHDEGKFLQGALWLIFYNLVFVLPLILILGLSNSKILLDKVESWRSKNSWVTKYGANLGMIILGLVIFLTS